MTYLARAFASCIIPTVVAGLAVIARCVTRFVVTNSYGLEEVLIVVAILASVGVTTLICLQVKNGFENNIILPPNEIGYQLKILYINVILYQVTLFSVKASILCQCLRLFCGRYRMACVIVLTFITAYAIAAVMASIFACWPIKKFWNPLLPGRCIYFAALWYANAGVQISTDILVCLLPMFVFRSLHLPKAQKYSLIAVFSLGGFGCICSIIRLVRLYEAEHETALTRTDVAAALWSSLEVNLGIICACLPNLRRPISLLIPQFVRTSVHGSSVSSFKKSFCIRLGNGTSSSDMSVSDHLPEQMRSNISDRVAS